MLLLSIIAALFVGAAVVVCDGFLVTAASRSFASSAASSSSGALSFSPPVGVVDASSVSSSSRRRRNLAPSSRPPRASSSSARLRTMLMGEQGSALRGGALVGSISSGLGKLRREGKTAMKKAHDAYELGELAGILFLAFGSESFLKFVNNQVLNRTIHRDKPKDFEESRLSIVSRLTCQLGQVGLIVYAGELFLIFLRALGVPYLQQKPKLLATSVYGYWIVRKLSDLKNYLLDNFIERYPNRIGYRLASRKLVYARAIDIILYLVGAIILLDMNQFDIGVALKSLLTLGGVSSLVVGLALKEPVTEIIQGTNLLLADKFRTGDVIKLGDGTAGSVVDMRWTDTQIRGTDDSFVRIPHTQLAKTRVINLSRTHRSQFLQEIKLPRSDLTKVHQIVDDIKEEIRTSCPKLIVDGTMPFRVHWTSFDGDKLVVTVDCNFRIRRLSDEYWDNRQNVLSAIARAIENNEKPAIKPPDLIQKPINEPNGNLSA